MLREKIFAACPPGLEAITAQELGQLGLRPSSPSLQDFPMGERDGHEAGGVEFFGLLRDVYRANLYLRTASRIWVQLGEFEATSFSQLRGKANHLRWERYLIPGQPVALRVNCRHSRLFHSAAVAERVIGAIGHRLKQVPPILKYQEQADTSRLQLIVVRLESNHCTISIDSSGELLYRRGYRRATSKAPLRETLAAAMLLASHWDPASPLLDPFCGAGTIAIEAALLARKMAPGRMRSFAFMEWPVFEPPIWKKLLEEEEAGRIPFLSAIMASDRDTGAIQAATSNAERAGVAENINFSCRSISSIHPPTRPGWVVTNPPYGKRLSPNKDLRHLYAQFGRVLRAKCPGWHLAILVNCPQLLGNMGFRFDAGKPLSNGGLRVRLMQAKVMKRSGSTAMKESTH